MTEPRKFRAGKDKTYAFGRMSNNRLAWVRTAAGQFIINRYRESDREQVDEGKEKVLDPEGGDTYILIIPAGSRHVLVNMTAMTMAEFDKLRDLFDLLFDLAEPVIRERDRVAADAFQKGDDSYTRIYRAVPEFAFRKGVFPADDQGILNRLEDAAKGVRRYRDSRGGPEAVRPELVEFQSEQSSGVHDPATKDQS